MKLGDNGEAFFVEESEDLEVSGGSRRPSPWRRVTAHFTFTFSVGILFHRLCCLYTYFLIINCSVRRFVRRD